MGGGGPLSLKPGGGGGSPGPNLSLGSQPSGGGRPPGPMNLSRASSKGGGLMGGPRIPGDRDRLRSPASPGERDLGLARHPGDLLLPKPLPLPSPAPRLPTPGPRSLLLLCANLLPAAALALGVDLPRPLLPLRGVLLLLLQDDLDLLDRLSERDLLR